RCEPLPLFPKKGPRRIGAIGGSCDAVRRSLPGRREVSRQSTSSFCKERCALAERPRDSPRPPPPDGRKNAAARKRRGGAPEGRASARGRRAGRAGEDALRPSDKRTYDEGRANFTLGRPADGTLPARFDGMSEVHYI